MENVVGGTSLRFLQVVMVVVSSLLDSEGFFGLCIFEQYII